MEFKNKLKKNNIYTKFIFLLTFILTFIITIVASLLILSKGQNQYLYRIIFIFIMIILLFLAILTIFIIIAVTLLWDKKKLPFIPGRLLELSVKIIYPIMLVFGRLFRYDINTIRGAFTELNNKVVFSKKYNNAAKDILILTPHCIQKSICSHRITTNIENCKRCGKCDVENLIKLKEKYNVDFRVVTGGTLARKIILDNRPKAIVAIACERDLISGLQDVKGLPIIAVINKRPEGPCFNTEVDLSEVEKAIQHFIIEKE